LLCGGIAQAQTVALAANDSESKTASSDSDDSNKIEALTDEVLELREMLEKLYQLTGHPLPPN